MSFLLVAVLAICSYVHVFFFLCVFFFLSFFSGFNSLSTLLLRAGGVLQSLTVALPEDPFNCFRLYNHVRTVLRSGNLLVQRKVKRHFQGVPQSIAAANP